MSSTNQQRAFTVITYFRKNEYVAAVQHVFRTRFKILPRQAILDRKSIILWVKNFIETGSVIRKRGGHLRMLEQLRTSTQSGSHFKITKTFRTKTCSRTSAF